MGENKPYVSYPSESGTFAETAADFAIKARRFARILRSNLRRRYRPLYRLQVGVSAQVGWYRGIFTVSSRGVY